VILVENRFIYLATPATGSRSVTLALRDQCGGKLLAKSHHAYLSDMDQLKDHDVPVYAFIRDPYDYVLTRYYYTHKTPALREQETLEDWIPKYAEENYGDEFGSIMCMYRDYVDDMFLYEDGLENFFEKVGLPDVTMPTEGAWASYQIKNGLPSIDELENSRHVRELIDQYFAMEVALYGHYRKQHSDAVCSL